jgi:hypothetical protein
VGRGARGYRARAKSQPLAFWNDPAEKSVFEADEDERRREFERRWAWGGFRVGGPYTDVGTDIEANRVAAEWVAGKIREIVKKPDVAEKLIPRTYPFGHQAAVRRYGYYAVYNRDNVTLVDIRETPIERITATGVRTTAGEHPCDAIVYAIGFDAMTGTLAKIDIRGRGGLTLKDKWAHGPGHVLGADDRGLSPTCSRSRVPGSPIGADQHGDVDRAAHRVDRRCHRLAARARADDDRGDARGRGGVGRARRGDRRHHALSASRQLVHGRQRAGQAAGVPALLGGFDAYVQACNDIAADDYRGFAKA